MENEKFINIVDLANQYCYCVNILDQRGDSDVQNIEERMRVVFPLINFGCLTCEMYLKALGYKNEGELCKGHDLSELFKKLTNEEQNRCKTEFNQWIGQDGDFDKEIERIKVAYTGWRYLYERGWTRNDDNSGISPRTITKFMTILHDICNEYKNALRKK